MYQRGLTYVALLIAIAMFGAGLAMAGALWSTDAKREREVELLFVGDQFRRAITAYHDEAPAGQPNRFPAKLEDLLQDRRWPTTRRHLRKIFVDPMTGNREWSLVRAPDNTIIGVHSVSEAEPLKRAGFAEEYTNFETAKTYREWQFVFSQPKGKTGGARNPQQPQPKGPTPTADPD